jgi:hypothetical protein
MNPRAEAISRMEQSLAIDGLVVDLHLGSSHRQPFRSASFDFSFAWCGINNGTRRLFLRSLAESTRVVRGGLVLFRSYHESIWTSATALEWLWNFTVPDLPKDQKPV